MFTADRVLESHHHHHQVAWSVVALIVGKCMQSQRRQRVRKAPLPTYICTWPTSWLVGTVLILPGRPEFVQVVMLNNSNEKTGPRMIGLHARLGSSFTNYKWATAYHKLVRQTENHSCIFSLKTFGKLAKFVRQTENNHVFFISENVWKNWLASGQLVMICMHDAHEGSELQS